MANINLYATLAEYKSFSTARGQSSSTDSTDDVVIADMLETASRYLDSKTGRRFYPAIETKLYDFPITRDLDIRDDLLEVISLTNGDGTAIASGDYVLDSVGFTPYWNLRLRSNASVYWSLSSTDGVEQIIELLGWFGYREHYTQRAWLLAGTLGAAITDTTTLAFTMTAGHTLTAGQIVKIGTEIYNIATVSTNTITPISRGDNGSTAATHLNGASVYTWKPQEEARDAVLSLTRRMYKLRFGQSSVAESTIAPSGAILPPKEIPTMVNEFISTYKRRIL